MHFNVTEHPTAEWTAAQLMQAFPWDTAPRYLLLDRDQNYGDAFRKQAASMAIGEVLTAPKSPWQSPYVERLIGFIPRECLDHVMDRAQRAIAPSHPSIQCLLLSRFLLSPIAGQGFTSD